MILQRNNLIVELRENSGLDEDFFDHQMSQILSAYAMNPETLEIDQLREVLADYLQGLILAEEKSA